MGALTGGVEVCFVPGLRNFDAPQAREEDEQRNADPVTIRRIDFFWHRGDHGRHRVMLRGDLRDECVKGIQGAKLLHELRSQLWVDRSSARSR